MRVDSILIDQLEVSDWLRLRAIRMRALREAPGAFAETTDEARAMSEEEWRASLAREDAVAFLASDGRTDFGCVMGSPYDGVVCAAGLFGMWVAPEARGKGAGGLLVRALIDWAVAGGYERILLDVGDDNAAAIGLYRSVGFVPTGDVGALPPPRQHITEHQRALTLVRRGD